VRLTSNDDKSVGLRAASGDTHGVPIATSGERSGAIKKRDRIRRLADLDLSLVGDRRVVSGIIYVIRNGLKWRDAPVVYGPHKTLYNRFVRWSRMGIFDRIFANLAAESGPPDRVMIDSTHLKSTRSTPSA